MARRKPIEERFWAKVDKDGPVPTHAPHLGACWVWLRGRSLKGYGTFWVDTTMQAAHRVAWVITRGAIPADKPHVLHYCDNPPCVNPSHLWVGTNYDNVQDKIQKGRGSAPCGDRHGRHTMPERTARGERAGRAKLTENDVREIRRRRSRGEFAMIIAKSYGVCEATVTHICTRRNWAHVD